MKLRKLAVWSLALACAVLFVAEDAQGRGGGGGGGFGGGRGGGPGFGGGGRIGPGGGRGGTGGREGERKEEQERERQAEREARVEQARLEYAKRERQETFDEESGNRSDAALERILRSTAE